MAIKPPHSLVATLGSIMGKMMTTQERQDLLQTTEKDYERLFEMLSAICASVMTEERTSDLMCAMALARESFIAHTNRQYETMLAVGYPKLKFTMDDFVRLENMFDQILMDMPMLDRRSIYNQINILICELSGFVGKHSPEYGEFVQDQRMDPGISLFSIRK